LGRGEWLPFQNFGLWQTSITLWREGKTGILVVDRDGTLRTVQFQRGQVVTADSQDPEDNLVQVFLDQECFTLENYLQAAANFNEDQSLGESMVQFGLITRSELVQGNQAKVFRVFKRTMQLPEGRYRFDATQPAAMTSGPSLDFPLDWFRAFLDVDDRQWVLDQMGAHLAFRIEPVAQLPDSVWQDPEMADLASLENLLDGPEDFKSLVLASSAEEFRLLKFLKMAEWLGYVRFGQGRDNHADAVAVPEAREQSVVLPEPEAMQEAVLPRVPSRRWPWIVSGSVVLVVLAMLGWAWLGTADAEPDLERTEGSELQERAQKGADFAPSESAEPEAEPELEFTTETSVAMARGEIDAAAEMWREASLAWTDQFTLGIYMVCDPGNAFKLWRKFPDDQRFFILPHQFQEQPCYWVCWGQYSSRLQALTARKDLPQGLLEVAPDAEVYPLTKLR